MNEMYPADLGARTVSRIPDENRSASLRAARVLLIRGSLKRPLAEKETLERHGRDYSVHIRSGGEFAVDLMSHETDDPAPGGQSRSQDIVRQVLSSPSPEMTTDEDPSWVVR